MDQEIHFIQHGRHVLSKTKAEQAIFHAGLSKDSVNRLFVGHTLRLLRVALPYEQVMGLRTWTAQGNSSLRQPGLALAQANLADVGHQDRAVAQTQFPLEITGGRCGPEEIGVHTIVNHLHPVRQHALRHMKLPRGLGHGNQPGILVQVRNDRLVQSNDVAQMRSAGHWQLRGNASHHAPHGKAVRMDQVRRNVSDYGEQVSVDLFNGTLVSLHAAQAQRMNRDTILGQPPCQRPGCGSRSHKVKLGPTQGFQHGQQGEFSPIESAILKE